MSGRRIRALSLAAALVAWSGLVAPRLSDRLLAPVQAVLAALLVARVGAPLGLRPPGLWRGARTGATAAAAVAAVVASSTVLPPVRTAMAARKTPASVAGWLLIRIPVGTVWSEEAAYRAALGTVAGEAFGPRSGRILQSLTFGLSHVADARGAGDPVAATVAVTAVAGWVFGWLNDHAGSLAAPMLAHLAVNEAGAVAALAVGR